MTSLQEIAGRVLVPLYQSLSSAINMCTLRQTANDWNEKCCTALPEFLDGGSGRPIGALLTASAAGIVRAFGAETATLYLVQLKGPVYFVSPPHNQLCSSEYAGTVLESVIETLQPTLVKAGEGETVRPFSGEDEYAVIKYIPATGGLRPPLCCICELCYKDGGSEVSEQEKMFVDAAGRNLDKYATSVELLVRTVGSWIARCQQRSLRTGLHRWANLGRVAKGSLAVQGSLESVDAIGKSVL